MTERNPPVWMQSGTYNAVDDRMVTGLLSDRTFTSGASAFSGIMGGVVPPFNQLAATVPGNTMKFSIGSGAVIVPSITTSPPGAFLCYNDGSSEITFDIESSGNPRYDIVYAEVLDQTAGDLTSTWRFGVKKGAPSASPTRPILTGTQYPLYQVKVVPAAQNGGVNKVMATQLTDLRVFNSAQGGIHISKSGLPNPAHSPGRLMYSVDSNTLYLSNGLAYEALFTYDKWMAIFSPLRPKHVSHSAVELINHVNHYQKWLYNPRNEGKTTAVGACQITGMRSPSGSFKVSIAGRGYTNKSNVAGHMSVRVIQGSTTMWVPAGGWKGIVFYQQQWAKAGTVILVAGMPVNTDLTFRLEYYQSGGGSTVANAHFTEGYLMVEPIL